MQFGCGDYSEDIVQEMYLKAHKYIESGTLRPETMNTYVYTIIRSLSVDLQRERAKRIKVELNDNLIIHNDQTNKEAYEKVIVRLEDEIESWHWFDKMLFKDIYIDQDLSMRDIEQETKISLSTIFHTIKRCKQKAIENVGEDYTDYLNNDYERI